MFSSYWLVVREHFLTTDLSPVDYVLSKDTRFPVYCQRKNSLKVFFFSLLTLICFTLEFFTLRTRRDFSFLKVWFSKDEILLLSKSRVVVFFGNQAGLMLSSPLFVQFMKAPEYFRSSVIVQFGLMTSLKSGVAIGCFPSDRYRDEGPFESFNGAAAVGVGVSTCARVSIIIKHSQVFKLSISIVYNEYLSSKMSSKERI